MQTELFQIEMLPACEGDCLMLTWGQYRLLIDGGRSRTYSAVKQRFNRLPMGDRVIELFVVTHIDRDHIEGALAILEDTRRPINIRDIWFNGYDHLRNQKLETFGAVHGERLTTALLTQHLPWNTAFQGNAVETRVEGVWRKLPGGLNLRLLSPTRSKLEALVPRWEGVCREAGLIPGTKARRREIQGGMEAFGSVDVKKLAARPFKPDQSAPNGSSIALLVEYRGKRILLGADAHPDLLESSVRKLAQKEADGKLRLDAFKISHHGSEHNTSPALLSLLSCSRFLVSTNGSVYGHPDDAAIARLICFGGKSKEIIFNYRTKQTAKWDNPRWQVKYDYRARYPSEGKNGTVVISL
jgi:beta-lactamase superfamily II metal-dependent hydrolase